MAESSWSLGRALRGMFVKPTIDESTWDDLETALLTADFGPDISERIVDELVPDRPPRDDVVIVSHTDRKGRITFVNDDFCEYAGMTREELLGQPHNVIRHPGPVLHRR